MNFFNLPKLSIRAARVNMGMSQLELANMIGVSSSTINSWENGRTQPTYENMLKISDVTGWPIDILNTTCQKKMRKCCN